MPLIAGLPSDLAGDALELRLLGVFRDVLSDIFDLVGGVI